MWTNVCFRPTFYLHVQVLKQSGQYQIISSFVILYFFNDCPVTTLNPSLQVPALMVVGSLPEKPVPGDTPLKPQNLPVPAEQPDEAAAEADKEKELTFHGLLTKHAKFLNDVAKLQVSDLILPLRELAHYDSQVRGFRVLGGDEKQLDGASHTDRGGGILYRGCLWRSLWVGLLVGHRIRFWGQSVIPS